MTKGGWFVCPLAENLPLQGGNPVTAQSVAEAVREPYLPKHFTRNTAFGERLVRCGSMPTCFLELWLL